MNTEALDDGLISRFSDLFHATLFEKALSILQTQSIFGADAHRHANFGVCKRPDLARDICPQVYLNFHWPGPHEVMFSTGDFSPRYWINGPKPNVLYHVRSGESIENNYWQSNLFPGSTGLVFKEATLVGIPSNSKMFIDRLLSKDSRGEHKESLWQQEWLFKLNKFRGALLSVPN